MASEIHAFRRLPALEDVIRGGPSLSLHFPESNQRTQSSDLRSKLAVLNCTRTVLSWSIRGANGEEIVDRLNDAKMIQEIVRISERRGIPNSLENEVLHDLPLFRETMRHTRRESSTMKRYTISDRLRQLDKLYSDGSRSSRRRTRGDYGYTCAMTLHCRSESLLCIKLPLSSSRGTIYLLFNPRGRPEAEDEISIVCTIQSRSVERYLSKIFPSLYESSHEASHPSRNQSPRRRETLPKTTLECHYFVPHPNLESHGEYISGILTDATIRELRWRGERSVLRAQVEHLQRRMDGVDIAANEPRTNNFSRRTPYGDRVMIEGHGDEPEDDTRSTEKEKVAEYGREGISRWRLERRREKRPVELSDDELESNSQPSSANGAEDDEESTPRMKMKDLTSIPVPAESSRSFINEAQAGPSGSRSSLASSFSSMSHDAPSSPSDSSSLASTYRETSSINIRYPTSHPLAPNRSPLSLHLAPWTQSQHTPSPLSAVARRSKPTRIDFYCSICLDLHPIPDKAKLPGCGHRFGRECLRPFVEEKIDARMWPVACPVCVTREGEEPGIVNENLLIELGVGRDKREKFRETALGSVGESMTCSGCKRTFILPHSHQSSLPDPRIVTCPFSQCERRWCKECDEEVSDGPRHTFWAAPFKTFGQGTGSLGSSNMGEGHVCNDPQAFEEFLESKGWKRCPGCKTPIERISGCDHMKCSNPVCNTDFCYRCGLRRFGTWPLGQRCSCI